MNKENFNSIDKKEAYNIQKKYIDGVKRIIEFQNIPIEEISEKSNIPIRRLRRILNNKSLITLRDVAKFDRILSIYTSCLTINDPKNKSQETIWSENVDWVSV